MYYFTAAFTAYIRDKSPTLTHPFAQRSQGFLRAVRRNSEFPRVFVVLYHAIPKTGYRLSLDRRVGPTNALE